MWVVTNAYNSSPHYSRVRQSCLTLHSSHTSSADHHILHKLQQTLKNRMEVGKCHLYTRLSLITHKHSPSCSNINVALVIIYTKFIDSCCYLYNCHVLAFNAHYYWPIVRYHWAVFAILYQRSVGSGKNLNIPLIFQHPGPIWQYSTV